MNRLPNLKWRVLFALSFSAASLAANHHTAAGLHLLSGKIEILSDSVAIDLRVRAEGIRSNYMLDLSPSVACDGTTMELPHLFFTGRKKWKQIYRSLVLSGRDSLSAGRRQLMRHYGFRRADSVAHYRHVVPLAVPPGGEVHLTVNRTLEGCCTASNLGDTLLLAAVRPMPPRVQEPAPVASPQPTPFEKLLRSSDFIYPISRYVPGEMATDKERGLKILFPKDKYTIEEQFLTNITELQRFKDAMHVIRQDSLHAIAKIVILGYTSVEGSWAHNEKLSLHRAEALKQVALDCGVPDDRIELYPMGEAWDELTDMIKGNENVPYKEEVLRIIRNVPIMNGRETALMKLKGGVPYRWIEKHFFPYQRNAGYIRIYFSTR